MATATTRRNLPPETDPSPDREWPTATSIPKLVRLLDGAVSESLLYQRAQAGDLPGCRRIGHRFIIHVPTFLAWLTAGTGDESPQSD